jgi:hypothetical protein
MYNTLISLKNEGHNISVLLVEYNENDKKSFLNDLENDTNETKITFEITDKIEVLKKMDIEKIRIFDMPEFDKKKMRSGFHNKCVNIVLGKSNQIIPMYIGLFPNIPAITDILNTEKINNETLKSQTTQQTPLHITLEYLGGKIKANDHESNNESKLNNNSPTYLDYPFGKSYEIDVIGYSNNEAGLCLVCNLPNDLIVQNSSIPHITLTTNKDFIPADVGKKIDEVNIKKFEKSYRVRSVLAAMF